MEHTLNEWSQNVESLLLKHKWLLLLNIPKLHKLSKLLRSSFRPDSDAEDIMDEIGFLFCSSVQARQKVTVAIKVIIFALTLGTWYCLPSYHLYFCLQDSMNTLRSELFNLERTNEASVPLKVCGMFLDALFKHSEIVDFSPQKYNNAHCLIHSTLRRPKLHSSDSMEVLHSAPNFSQGELISIIVNIYQGRLPQSYEFFRCHENSTAHQLKLFLTRATNHPLTFVILGVNSLPINLQEVHELNNSIIIIYFTKDVTVRCFHLLCCRCCLNSIWTFTHPVIIMKTNHVFTMCKHYHLFCKKCHGFNMKNTRYTFKA